MSGYDAPCHLTTTRRDDPLRRAPLVLGRHDFASVTETVCRVVERPRPPRAGTSPSPSPSALTVMFFAADRLPDRHGHRRLGQQQPRGLGLRHHQLRLLDRHRPRRHADLGHPVPLPPEVADRHQPLRRGDDDLRGDLRRPVPGDSRGPAVVRLLAGPVSEPDVGLAELPQPAAVGRVRREHLLHGVAAVLVPGHDSRPGHAARPGHDAGCGRSPTACSPWAGAARPGSGTSTSGPTCSWPAWPRRWC